MALSTRTDSPDAALESATSQTLPVGAELRARREANQADLTQIATQLRIRPAFLEAIEEMDYKRLPGLPYAIGFVRSYADYLGFDAGEMVARFKREAAGIEARAPLVFPSPAPEGKVPGPMPLTIALIVALGIAGAWYFWRDGVSDLVARVPEVPERLIALTSPAPAVKPAPSAEAPATPSAEAQPTAAAEETPPPPPTDVIPPAPPQAPVQAIVTPAPPPAPPVAQPLPALAVSPPAATPAQVAARTATPAPAAAPTNQIATAPGGGKIYGAQNEKTRVVIHARGESWLQVRDKDGQVLLTRVLHDGDSYLAPSMDGLQMSVGNAGVIEVTVDGASVPSLGPVGQVRRAIALDPDQLRKAPGSKGQPKG